MDSDISLRASVPAMKRLMVTMSLVTALAACGKKDNADKGKKETAPTSGTSAPAQPTATEPPAKPTEPPAKPTEPPVPADPTASWTEQKGAGFSVLAARAATEQKADVPSPAGPQPMTMYSGYHPASLKGAFQVAVVDMSAGAKKAKIDPDKTLTGAIDGWKKSIPGLTIENQSAIPGETGFDLRAGGNHPQGGPFKLRGRVIYKKERLYTVQSIYTDAKDAPLADKFIESFKVTD
jgi:hypothetical protein